MDNPYTRGAQDTEQRQTKHNTENGLDNIEWTIHIHVGHKTQNTDKQNTTQKTDWTI